MLGIILANQDKYPLDMVVNFDLEIDWKVAKDVVADMEQRCVSVGIPFVKIKPRKSWDELYEKYGFPNARARWCNSDYKLDCKKQLNDWIASQNCRPMAYIGFCADEQSRFKYELGEWENQDVCYPLAEEGILESDVLLWARKQSIFQGYYDNLDRMGCKMCPFLTMKEMAYLKQVEPETYELMFERIKRTEEMVKEKGRSWLFKNEGADIIKQRVDTKWISRIKYEQNQLTWDFLQSVYAGEKVE